jgi:hypothetical protein
MVTANSKSGLTVLLVAGVAITLVLQHRIQTRLREENESLRRQIAQLQAENLRLSRREAVAKLMLRLPALHIQATLPSNVSPAVEMQFTNLYSRFTNEFPKLTAAQVEAYLKANRTNAASLLAAYRTSDDPALLKEAMEKYPTDPEVAFEAVFDKNLSPAEQRQWLDAFKKSASDNALANYLSAYSYFNSGQADQGIQELASSSGKQFNDYSLERAQGDQEAYLSAGYSAAEAERIADSWLMIPQDSQVKHLGVDLVDLARAYRQSGDPASAQSALQMAISLGQSYASSPNDPILLNQLVGLAIQKTAFSEMDPGSSYGSEGQTVQDQINQINQTRANLRDLVEQATPWLPTMSDQDILNYENRRRAFGEVAALQWVVSKFGRQ